MANDFSTGGVLTPALPYPPDDDAIDDVLHALMVGITGLDPTLVRPRWQAVSAKQPEAGVNWCAIGVLSDTPDDGPALLFDAATLTLTLTRHEDIQALASFYGPLAKTYAAIARDGLSVPQNLEPLGALQMALIDTGSIREAHELINQTWFKRRDMPLHLRRKVTREYLASSLTSATVRLLDDTVVDVTITVP